MIKYFLPLLYLLVVSCKPTTIIEVVPQTPKHQIKIHEPTQPSINHKLPEPKPDLGMEEPTPEVETKPAEHPHISFYQKLRKWKKEHFGSEHEEQESPKSNE